MSLKYNQRKNEIYNILIEITKEPIANIISDMVADSEDIDQIILFSHQVLSKIQKLISYWNNELLEFSEFRENYDDDQYIDYEEMIRNFLVILRNSFYILTKLVHMDLKNIETCKNARQLYMENFNATLKSMTTMDDDIYWQTHTNCSIQ